MIMSSKERLRHGKSMPQMLKEMDDSFNGLFQFETNGGEEMHELTKRLSGCFLVDKQGDVIIREYLEEKAKKLNETGYSHDYVKEILGVTDKSLEEKLLEKYVDIIRMNSCTDGVKEIANIAKQHYKDHPEELR